MSPCPWVTGRPPTSACSSSLPFFNPASFYSTRTILLISLPFLQHTLAHHNGIHPSQTTRSQIGLWMSSLPAHALRTQVILWVASANLSRTAFPCLFFIANSLRLFKFLVKFQTSRSKTKSLCWVLNLRQHQPLLSRCISLCFSTRCSLQSYLSLFTYLVVLFTSSFYKPNINTMKTKTLYTLQKNSWHVTSLPKCLSND